MVKQDVRHKTQLVLSLKNGSHVLAIVLNSSHNQDLSKLNTYIPFKSVDHIGLPQVWETGQVCLVVREERCSCSPSTLTRQSREEQD